MNLLKILENSGTFSYVGWGTNAVVSSSVSSPRKVEKLS